MIRDIVTISPEGNLFSQWYTWQICSLCVKNNQSLTQKYKKSYIRGQFTKKPRV